MSENQGLSVAQKIELVEAIWDSIAADSESLPLTPDHREELNRRVQRFKADGPDGIDPKIAITEIRNHL